MSGSPRSHPRLAALRPWPFGPPLRGRAERGEAGVPAATRLAAPRRGGPASPLARRQALAPVGGLACPPPPCCVS